MSRGRLVAMYVLDSFWSAAAHLSGRLDLSTALSAGVDPSTADDATLRSHGVSPVHLGRLRNGRPLESIAPAVWLTHPAYPPLLRLLPFAPPVLFLMGAVELLTRPAVAIVGARRCSVLAERFARRLSSVVAHRGGVVVSGLAWGIDGAAHAAAEGYTIAVVAQSVDEPFSGSLRRRCEQLLATGGLVVSEFPPGQRPQRWTFRQRNRIISGLSLATVVVEAGERSGSLITARSALDQGRELFVVPDHPAHDHARGGLSLLEAGVAPLLDPDPVLEILGLGSPPPAAASEGLVRFLGDSPDIATLALRTGKPARELRQELSALELLGRVERLAGGRYAAVSVASRRSQ